MAKQKTKRVLVYYLTRKQLTTLYYIKSQNMPSEIGIYHCNLFSLRIANNIMSTRIFTDDLIKWVVPTSSLNCL